MMILVLRHVTPRVFVGRDILPPYSALKRQYVSPKHFYQPISPHNCVKVLKEEDCVVCLTVFSR
jgi:hypothetical protein